MSADETLNQDATAPLNAPAPAAVAAPGETAEAGVSSTPVTDSPVEPARRLQLNPIGGGSLLDRSAEEAQAIAEAAAMQAMGMEVKGTSTFTPQSTGPAPEIPREVDLGDMAAEIDAAMAGEARAAAAAPTDVSRQDLPEKGAKLQGTVQSTHGDDVFLDLGFRLPGVCQRKQFEGTEVPEAGARIPVVVRKVNEAEGLIEVNLPRGRQNPGGNWEAIEEGQIVDCVVTKTNKGGLEVTVGSIRGFLPASQVDLRFVESLEPFIGQRLQVKITEANAQKRNLVVSRKALLVEERKEKEQGFWESVTEGESRTGVVKTLKDYGAFIDLGGADGFLHIGEISWSRINHPNEVLQEGQEVTVKVLKIERDKKKISLGLKQVTQNPWTLASEKYIPQSIVTGKVRKMTEFGAFIELEPGIDGLIHISELDWKRVRKVEDVLKAGQEVEAKVLEFDPIKRRVSLSLKQMKDDPRKAEDEARAAARAKEEAEQAAADAAYAAKRPKQRGDLRGGTGSQGGIGGGMGLFGNPNDFR